jgi:hypothetical protein
MLPARLEDWTLATIETIAASGIMENDVYEFKANLQPPEHQQRTLAAFANTRGGYLVFGVNDSDRRIVGVKNPELIRDFGTRINRNIEPAPSYTFAPRITLSDGSFVYVVEIEPSPRGPIALHVDQRLFFLKRTAAGNNESMTYEEIRLAFQNEAARRKKIHMLIIELRLLKDIAKEIEHTSPSTTIQLTCMIHIYPTALLEALIADVFDVEEGHAEIARLTHLRRLIVTANGSAEQLSRIAFLPKAVVESRGIQNNIQSLAGLIHRACEELEQRIINDLL